MTRILLVAATTGCAMSTSMVPLAVGDSVRVVQPGSGLFARGQRVAEGVVQRATADTLTVSIASGSLVTIAARDGREVHRRRGMRGPGIIGKSILIGLVGAATPGLVAAAFSSDTLPQGCWILCASDQDANLFAAAMLGVGGATVGAGVGAFLAARPHWYRVPWPPR